MPSRCLALVLAAAVLAAPPSVLAQAPAKAPAAGAAAATSKAPVAPVDINKANASELTEVPGIGPALAKRIVDFREKNGAFGRVDDLLKVQGIGEKSLQRLAPHLTVSKAK